MTWSDNERAMMKDMAASAVEMLEAAGASRVFPNVEEQPVPGYGIHEAGIARMGDDPKTSVLNQFCQTHDVKNLFVMDASSFVSIALPEPDADDHGAGSAVVGLSEGSSAQGRLVSYERRATSDERRATSDERRATSTKFCWMLHACAPSARNL